MRRSMRISRRAVVTGLGGAALTSVAYALGAYRAGTSAARTRTARRSSLLSTTAGALEYAIAGRGTPIMMLHGTGGGFDQGLLFAYGLSEAGFQVIAPSRFGYLRSAFPDDPSPSHQADVLVELLDHLRIERLAVAGGSAGALTAIEFALRHPDRCTHLIPIVPAMNLTGRDPVAFSALQQFAVQRVLTSDAWFWVFATLGPDVLLQTLLATDPALLATVSPDERRRAALIREGLMPISDKVNGVRTDGNWAGAPSAIAVEQISVPTLILSCADDRFGTAATSRLLAARIPAARIIVYPTGGHIWLGHDDDVTREISAFVTSSVSETASG
jgi:2-hydroxy-6-oxonona-2,4-dienedioate hydrolase